MSNILCFINCWSWCVHFWQRTVGRKKSINRILNSKSFVMDTIIFHVFIQGNSISQKNFQSTSIKKMLRCSCWDYFFVPHKGYIRIFQVSFSTDKKHDFWCDHHVPSPSWRLFREPITCIERTIVMWTEQWDPLTEWSHLKCYQLFWLEEYDSFFFFFGHILTCFC